MSERQRLPNRRSSEQFTFQCNALTYHDVASSPLGVALDQVADDLKVTKITNSNEGE